MKIWALGDLHLPSARGKDMDMFGPAWENHPEKIASRWRERVGEEDIVLLVGDISWAMHLHEAEEDFAFLAALPGRKKILIRGNHDYWWTTKRKLRENTPEGFEFLHNSAFSAPPFVFAGTRGWELPLADMDEEKRAECERLCEREARRLTSSLEEARREKAARLIVMLHFPPIFPDQEETIFTRILDRFSPEVVIYGHLHGEEAIASAFRGRRGETRYVFVSADAVDFTPVLVAEGKE